MCFLHLLPIFQKTSDIWQQFATKMPLSQRMLGSLYNLMLEEEEVEEEQSGEMNPELSSLLTNSVLEFRGFMKDRHASGIHTQGLMRCRAISGCRFGVVSVSFW